MSSCQSQMLGSPRFSHEDAGSPPTHLRARTGWQAFDLRQLWRFRDLLWLLALRDVKVRYKQAVLGVLWAVLQPFVSMVVFVLVFGNMLGMGQKIEQGTPYPLFLFAGLLGWQFFEASVVSSSNSLIANADMLRKIYFPRLLVPLSAIGAPLVDYIVSFGVLIGLMIWYHVAAVGDDAITYQFNMTWRYLLLAPAVASIILAVLGVGILLAALTVSYRDFKYVVPFMVRIWFFLTPVIYPVEVLPSQALRSVLELNPMAGPINVFRAVILGGPINYYAWAVSCLTALVTLIVGLLYFNRVERRFADII